MLKFLHHKQLVEEAFLPAELTVLEYLREQRNHCGTKEGCASGDCGACTVVIAEVVKNTGGNEILTYRSANSCITFIGALHGKQLLTIENLAVASSSTQAIDKIELHRSQQTMVENHASQCGFCTPGFVMSLFAAMKTVKDQPAKSKPVSRKFIDEQLGGNLCRCTGYRPIIDAAKEALNSPLSDDHFDLDAAQTIKVLKSIESQSVRGGIASDADTSAIAGSGFYRPTTANELHSLKSSYPDALLLGGGTDLALSVTQQLNAIDNIIMTGGVTELCFINEDATEIRIGSATSLTELREAMVPHCPTLDSLLARFAGTQVRNQATIGGNFANASPVGDLPPVFMALNASMVLSSIRGERTVRVNEFFTSYKKTLLDSDEIISEFIIPRSSFYQLDNSRRIENRFYKVSKRIDDDISAVCAAFHIELEGKKIVSVSTGFGGMAAIPKPAEALEATISGRVLDEQCIADAEIALKKDFQPIDDVRATAEYRHKVTANLLRRLAAEIYTPDIATTVLQHGH